MQYEDDKKTRPQLIAELQSLRAQFAAMQSHSAKVDSHARVGANHYRRLFEIAQDGVVVHALSINPSGCRFLQANPEICRMLGYTSEEMLRLSPIDIQSEQGRQDVPAEAQTMDRQRRLLFRKVLVAKDGRRIPVEIHSTVFDQDGKTYCLSIIRDISERLAAEQAIRKSEAMLAHAQRIANIGSWEWDIPTGELLWSDQIYRIFGLDSKEFHPRHELFHTLVDPKDRDRVQQAIGQALAGKPYCVEFSITRPDSSVRRILSQGELEVDERGNPLHIFGTAMDITARKQAEERLAGSERQLAEAERLAHLGSWHWNITTNSVRWSDEHYRICGLRPDGSALTSERAIGCVHPDDREMLMARIDAALDGTAPYDCEFRVLRTDGEVCWAHTRGKVVRDSSGRPIEMFGTILDIHAQKEAERQLREAKEAAEQANQAKDQLLAVVSHELRTPLTPILAAADLAEAHPAFPAELRGEIDAIRRSVEHEARLVDDLLNLTRLQHSKVELHHEAVDTHALLRNVLEQFLPEMEAKNIVPRVMLNAERFHVWADAGRLQQVIANILSNAIKFTPPHGSISLCSSDVEGRIRMQIRDSGIGIDLEFLPRIFDPFEQGQRILTRSHGGMGMGLAIAKSIIDLHGGNLTAHSQGRNQGATFTIEVAALPTPVEQPTPTSDRCRILLVEDNPDTLRLMAQLLSGLGHHVDAAATFTQALCLADSGCFDVLVSDIGLPDGSGWDLMRRLRAKTGIAGIAISGYGTDEDLRMSREAGFAEHLVKPLNVQQLAAAIATVTNVHPADGSGHEKRGRGG